MDWRGRFLASQFYSPDRYALSAVKYLGGFSCKWRFRLLFSIRAEENDNYKINVRWKEYVDMVCCKSRERQTT